MTTDAETAVCNLGSINLARHLTTAEGQVTVDWARLRDTVRTAVPFLDRVIDLTFYPSKEAAAFGYAEAVRAEVADLFAAGADIVQLDEPYLQARPETAKQYGVKVLNAALEGSPGPTAVHLCFGYAAIIHERPSGYSFLPEFAESLADQISIETAQSGLDCAVLADLTDKTIILGVIDLNDPAVETSAVVADRVRRALPYVPAERIVLAPDCGMKYLPRESAAGKLSSMTQAARTLRGEFAS